MYRIATSSAVMVHLWGFEVALDVQVVILDEAIMRSPQIVGMAQTSFAVLAETPAGALTPGQV